MAFFLALSITGVAYFFGYFLFGLNKATLYFGIAFWFIGSLLAIIKDFQLTKKLKSLREYHIEVSALFKSYLKPDIYAEFYDLSLAEVYSKIQNQNGYHVNLTAEENGKIIVTSYKEKEDNEKESNK